MTMLGPFPYLSGFGRTQAPACQLKIEWGGRVHHIRALIDSGASASCIPDQTAQALGLRLIGEGNVGGAVSESSQKRRYYIANLEFFNLTFPNHPIVGLPNTYAIIGRDILNLFVTTLNGPALQFSIQD